ncbi:MAG: 16S rRNA (cytosine(1402)-N(4))-methyltransferase RsmH [Proteobacteria bacterium]|nr:16S rRNA (cytosine(1402)-N(4))-methyltransferase RsmH [Pseudomonadota bacterium]
MTSFDHITVLLNETVDILTGPAGNPFISEGEHIWADCTLGGAGHTLRLLKNLAQNRINNPQKKVQHEILCCDQDPLARQTADQRISDWLGSDSSLREFISVKLLAINFRDLPAWLLANKNGRKVTGLMADLGVSSPQIDVASRGFSFLREGPLDMRMNTEAPTTAHELLSTLDAAQLQRIFDEYGEEPRARALARAIVQDRDKGTLPLSNTVEFAKYVERVLGYHQSRVHPATRVFQALRIAVNEELASVEELLGQLPEIMSAGGRVGVISFHSLEDRLVKRYFRAWEQGERTPEAKRASEKKQWQAAQMGLYAASEGERPSFGREEPRGGVVASADESKLNPRSRSARLRGFTFAEVRTTGQSDGGRS